MIVTDRDNLDGQIYRNFLNTGTVTKAEAAQPKSGEEMRKFLGQNKRFVFTLIQKFHWPKGKQYPLLSPRDDIILIVDEAHPTQYRSLPENLRQGLPNESKERVKSTVQEVLNMHLPESYDRALFTKKCDTVFELMVNYASQGLKWAA